MSVYTSKELKGMQACVALFNKQKYLFFPLTIHRICKVFKKTMKINHGFKKLKKNYEVDKKILNKQTKIKGRMEI